MLAQESFNVVPVNDLSPPDPEVRVDRMQPPKRTKAHRANRRRSPAPMLGLFLTLFNQRYRKRSFDSRKQRAHQGRIKQRFDYGFYLFNHVHQDRSETSRIAHSRGSPEPR
jgi:hypothetical protein